MIVTYTPTEGQKRQWNYRGADLPSNEAEDIEEAVGVTFDTWQQRLLEGGIKARRALLWVLRRRDEPKLRFSDVTFTINELEIEFDADEKVQVRAEVEKSEDLTDAERRRVLELLADDEDTDGGGKATTFTPNGHSEVNA